ncbi:hypothetical protein QJS10_CPB13g01248 [Acorus calamus]|uniref:Uncharacterized protein n=1 Tax=Acorus calamus TaxID=4465 RepID=A0AAV9DJ64_ACOCL|nr:hypothetical protein QJS10_CPB13g01248 [Acorus calamus]
MNEVREGREMYFKNSPSQILSKIQGQPWFRWSAPMQSDESKRDQNLRCDYHNGVDHTTGQCRFLQTFLENQI